MLKTVLILTASFTTTDLKVELGDADVADLAKYARLERLTIVGTYDASL
ncbi:MAG: hypothetical protein OER88_03960 [Planctomycetota bacterium]|nr:hypothetical protein [Planctomycetota bacterium]